MNPVVLWARMTEVGYSIFESFLSRVILGKSSLRNLFYVAVINRLSENYRTLRGVGGPCYAISVSTFEFWLSSYSEKEVYGKVDDGTRDLSKQAGFQFLGVVVSFGIAVVGGLITGDRYTFFRPSKFRPRFEVLPLNFSPIWTSILTFYLFLSVLSLGAIFFDDVHFL